MRLNIDCLTIVADGKAANFLQNQDAGGTQVRLQTLHTMALDNEASSHLGSDRPGHMQLGASTRKGSYEQTDLHQQNEERFLQQVAVKAQALFKARGCHNVSLVAEPRALGVLRKALAPELRAASVLELAKDYTKSATGDLAKILAAHQA